MQLSAFLEEHSDVLRGREGRFYVLLTPGTIPGQETQLRALANGGDLAVLTGFGMEKMGIVNGFTDVTAVYMFIGHGDSQIGFRLARRLPGHMPLILVVDHRVETDGLNDMDNLRIILTTRSGDGGLAMRQILDVITSS
jgi:hypothetical protein